MKRWLWVNLPRQVSGSRRLLCQQRYILGEIKDKLGGQAEEKGERKGEKRDDPEEARGLELGEWP